MPKMTVHDPGALTRTAMGPAIQWYGMYNDRPEITGGNAMAGLSANDTRASNTGPVAWADDVAHSRVRWNEKYVASDEGHLGPVAWTESKNGLTSDKLLAEKEAAAVKRPVGPGGYRQNGPSPFLDHQPRLSDRPSLEHRARGPAAKPPPSKLEGQVVDYRGQPVYSGRQLGYGTTRDVKEAYWDFTLRQPIGAASSSSRPISSYKGPVGEEERLARANELHHKLGINKVKLHTRVDTTPQAGHHTAALPEKDMMIF